MSDISRDDLNRIHDAIDGVRDSVSQSEVRLTQRIDSARIENDKIYVREKELEPRLQLLENKFTTLAEVVSNALGRRDWTNKAIIVAALALVGNLVVAIINHLGWK